MEYIKHDYVESELITLRTQNLERFLSKLVSIIGTIIEPTTIPLNNSNNNNDNEKNSNEDGNENSNESTNVQEEPLLSNIGLNNQLRIFYRSEFLTYCEGDSSNNDNNNIQEDENESDSNNDNNSNAGRPVAVLHHNYFSYLTNRYYYKPVKVTKSLKRFAEDKTQLCQKNLFNR